jgi:hypothetical protein
VGGVSPERLNNQKEFFGEHCLILPKDWHDHPLLPLSCLLILSGGLRDAAEMVSSLVYLVSSDWRNEAGSRDREVLALICHRAKSCRPVRNCARAGATVRGLRAPARTRYTSNRKTSIPGLAAVIASAAKQSSLLEKKLDCFVAFAPRNDESGRRTGRMTKATQAVGVAMGLCLCGEVRFEIDTPARWAWHDHSAASRRAHGAVYATYVGSWRKRSRVTKGKAAIARYEDKATKAVRSFCARCGTPLAYERARSPHMVNIPRALFSGRTGRQPLYHVAIEELQEWAWTGEPLVPLKGFPGVVWQRSKKKKRVEHEGMF